MIPGTERRCRATLGRSDDQCNSTASRRNSSGYLLGRPIQGLPSPETHLRIGCPRNRVNSSSGTNLCGTQSTIGYVSTKVSRFGDERRVGVIRDWDFSLLAGVEGHDCKFVGDCPAFPAAARRERRVRPPREITSCAARNPTKPIGELPVKASWTKETKETKETRFGEGSVPCRGARYVPHGVSSGGVGMAGRGWY